MCRPVDGHARGASLATWRNTLLGSGPTPRTASHEAGQNKPSRVEHSDTCASALAIDHLNGLWGDEVVLVLQALKHRLELWRDRYEGHHQI